MVLVGTAVYGREKNDLIELHCIQRFDCVPYIVRNDVGS